MKSRDEIMINYLTDQTDRLANIMEYVLHVEYVLHTKVCIACVYI